MGGWTILLHGQYATTIADSYVHAVFVLDFK